MRPADALDFFPGGVPPGTIFEIHVRHLRKLVTSVKPLLAQSSTAAEVCLIGLAAFFEAFCKDQFASIINICPETLTRFVAKRKTVTVDVADLLMLSSRGNFLGFPLAEKYDFGSAKEVNGLYNDLLDVTPFSRREVRIFAEFLSDRNLLVHHGGAYTFKHVARKVGRASVRAIPYWDSIEVTQPFFKHWADFLEGLAKKMVVTSHEAVEAFIRSQNIHLDETRARGLWYLQWYD